jgi:lipopolysaccharide export system permease protein
MTIITRIIVSEWFKSFIGAFLILFLVSTTADILGGFLRGKEFDYIMTYYLIKIPSLISKMLPAACLLATLFSFNNLKNHSELIAILATGYSTKRIITLIIYLASGVALFQFIVVSYLEPMSNKLKLNYEYELQKENLTRLGITTSTLEGGKVWYKSSTYFASFSGFDKDKNELKELSLYYFSPNYKGSKIIHSKTAKFYKDNLWILEDGISYSHLEGDAFPSPSNFENITMSLNEIPEDFKKFESEVKTLNIVSLWNFIKRVERTGINVNEYKVQFYEKISLTIICIIFALFSLTTIYNPNTRSGSFAKSVVFTLGFSVFYWLIHSSTLALGASGDVPPFIATIGIPMTFILYLSFSFYKHQKL